MVGVCLKMFWYICMHKPYDCIDLIDVSKCFALICTYLHKAGLVMFRAEVATSCVVQAGKKTVHCSACALSRVCYCVVVSSAVVRACMCV